MDRQTVQVGKIGSAYARKLVNRFENAVFDLTALNFTSNSELEIHLTKVRYEQAKHNLLTYIANR